MSDNELRKLFQQAGRPPMGADLTDRIMARVAVTPVFAPIEVKPLIGKAGWFAIAVLFIGLLVFLINASGMAIDGDGSSVLDPLWQKVPRFEMPRIALPAGQWPIWAAIAAGGMLLLTLVDRAVEKVIR